MEQVQNEEHSLSQMIILHLFPGILVGCFYFLARQPVVKMGYPTIFALLMAFAFVLIPFELGYLFYKGKKRTGRFTLQGIISYRNPILWWQYLISVFVIFITVGAIFTLLKPVDAFLQEKLFFWMPEPNLGLDGSYSRTILIVTYVMFLVFNVILAPMVEELYFRGYLLPRMKGRFGSLLHSFLFAAIHVFTPWMIITRTLGLLPIVYGVKKTNIYVGMTVHMLGNAMDLLTAVVFISKMT